jgi:hypothetical protein
VRRAFHGSNTGDDYLTGKIDLKTLVIVILVLSLFEALCFSGQAGGDTRSSGLQE